jgi:SAM-dependent methyltransferase
VNPVAPANEEMQRSWDGDSGAFWTARADSFDRSMARYHPLLMAAAAIGAGDRVLDIGCGTGRTTRDAARAAVDGSALGLDLSSEMLAYARRKATDERVANATFEQADVQVYPFEPESFDVALSRAGSMFFGEPVTAFANVARALRPGGRLALLTWQSLDVQEWFRSFVAALAAGRDLPTPPPGAPGPFSLSDPDRVKAILGDAGFTGVGLEAVHEPMCFGTDAADAAGFVMGMLGWLLGDLDDAGRARAHDALHATMSAHETPDGVLFTSGGWIVRATRP